MKRWAHGRTIFGSPIIEYAIGALMVFWPFFKYPGQIFYARYFEAATVFSPAFVMKSNLTGWSEAFHAGYAPLLEIGYVSLVTVIIGVIHWLSGDEITSKLYPALIQLCVFVSFLLYCRRSFPTVPRLWRIGAAVFYTTNPIPAGMVHEGYPSLLIDYALLPLSIYCIDVARARAQAMVLVCIPLIFVATSMIRVQEVALVAVALLTLRSRTIYALLRSNRRACFAVALALCLNFWWVMPLALNAGIHSYIPVASDTASEVSATTQYGTLTNVVLLRIFGSLGVDGQFCSACSWYMTPTYSASMLFVFGFSFAALVRFRKYRLLALLVASLLFSTGYRYQDELIGVFYQLAVSAIHFNVFRAAGVALIVSSYCEAVGLLFAWRWLQTIPNRNVYAACTALAIIGVCAPMIDGAIFEKGALKNGVVQGPNLFARIPDSYQAARNALQQSAPDGPTLLLPNQTFAQYKWGGYVQDFLPGYLRVPTLVKTYWAQPNPKVDDLLESVSTPKYLHGRIMASLAALRVSEVLIHNDVVDAPLVLNNMYGKTVFAQGNIRIAKSAFSPLPRFQEAQRPLTALGSVEGATIAAVSNGIAVDDFVDLRRVHSCPDNWPIGAGNYLHRTTASQPITFSSSILCAVKLRVDVIISGRPSHPKLQVIDTMLHRAVSVPLVETESGGFIRYSAMLKIPSHFRFVLTPDQSGSEVLAFLVSRPGMSYQAHTARVQNFFSIGYSYKVPADVHVFSYNASNDPTWVMV